MKHRLHRSITEDERYNLAGDYNKGRIAESPELGYPSFTLDEYIMLVRKFAAVAMTFDMAPKEQEDDDLDFCLSRLEIT